MKATLAGNEAVTSEAAGSAYVENFALKVFLAADNLDRSGQCDKCVTHIAYLEHALTSRRTISKFVVASQFLEVLRCFQAGMSDEVRLTCAVITCAYSTDGAEAPVCTLEGCGHCQGAP